MMRYEAELDLVLPEIMACWDVPGLAVGIVKDAEIVYAKTFGVRSLETQAPLTLDTIFCVQSVSKCFVATAMMQLVERGWLELDAPLVGYLPYFKMNDERCRQITIRQMLSHTAGMPDIEETDYIDWVAHPELDDGAAERFLRSLGDKKLVANPGEGFHYSNIGYNILGDLLAKVTGVIFETHMREQVLLPAGMMYSSFLLTDLPPDLLAWPHLRSPEMKISPFYPYQRADAPASFLHTTVGDLCEWAITSLKRGGRPGRRILPAASYDLMWTAVASRGNPPGLYEEMGLGWTLGHFKDQRTVSHGGAGFGWTSFLLLLPELNCAVVVFCNEESSACRRAVQAAAEALTGEKPQAGPVSGMVPISRALAEGGMEAASACCAGLKESGSEEIYFDEYDLENLALQLRMAGRPDLAIEVLQRIVQPGKMRQ